MKLRPGNYGKETSFEVRTVDAEMPLDEYVRLPGIHLLLVHPPLRAVHLQPCPGILQVVFNLKLG